MSKHLNTVAALALLAAAGLTPASALAAGVFDFVDPCIKAKNDFAEQRREYFSRLDEAQNSIDTQVVPAEFRDAWMKAVRAQARPVFNKDVAPLFQKLGINDLELAFDEWFKQEMDSYSPEQLNQVIASNFRELVKEEALRVRLKSEAAFEKGRQELGSSCKSDVGNQALRVAMAPLGWVAGNWEGAKREKNIITGVIRAATGISLKDMAKYGFLGGENSELRKLANAVGGGENSEVRKTLRFFDPGNRSGIFGGSNSVFRKPFG